MKYKFSIIDSYSGLIYARGHQMEYDPSVLVSWFKIYTPFSKYVVYIRNDDDVIFDDGLNEFMMLHEVFKR